MRINLNNFIERPHQSQTRQRQLLLELIRESNGHIDAKELFKLAAGKNNSISLATVYRSLNLFKQMGIIDEQRLGQARCYYEIKQSTQHQHLVCSRCGEIIDFDCPLSEMVDRVKNERNFTVTKAEVYLEGYCSECAEENRKGNHAR